MNVRTFVYITGEKTLYLIVGINKYINYPFLEVINTISDIVNYCHEWPAINMTEL